MVDDEMVGRRIRTARKSAGYNQAHLAHHLGICISTVSDIERGQRSVSGPELYSLAELLGQPLDFFLTPRLGSPWFQDLYRQATEQGVERSVVEQFETLCRDYALLERITHTPTAPNLPDYSGFGFETTAGAEKLAVMERGRLGLGEGPILDMSQLLDEQGGVRVFHLPLAGKGLSGAAASDPDGWGCILVNAAEPTYTRAFTIAHEYAHCLVHPQPSDDKTATRTAHLDRRPPEQDFGTRNRHERFYNAFAGSFLMPAHRVASLYERLVLVPGRFTDDVLYVVAKHFGVSDLAVGWRLVSLRLITRRHWESYLDTGRRPSILARRLGYEQEPKPSVKPTLPPRYEYLAWRAFDEGEISLSRLAELLHENVFDLRQQAQSRTIEPSMDLMDTYDSYRH